MTEQLCERSLTVQRAECLQRGGNGPLRNAKAADVETRGGLLRLATRLSDVRGTLQHFARGAAKHFF